MRILILTADIGAGHDLPAELLSEAITARAPGTEVTIADGLVAMGRLMVALGRTGAETILQHGRPLFELQYWLVSRFAPTRRLAGRLLTALAHYGALVLEWRRASDEAAREAARGEAGRLREVVLASLSHDLRTPLATITALAQDAAARGDATAPAIVEQAGRLARLVENVLDLARLGAPDVRRTRMKTVPTEGVGAYVLPLVSPPPWTSQSVLPVAIPPSAPHASPLPVKFE